VAAYAGGLIVSSPPIAYVGARLQGKRAPLLLSLLFMAGGVSFSLRAGQGIDVDCLAFSYRSIHGDCIVHCSNDQSSPSVSR
jgi:hypothetical protein